VELRLVADVNPKFTVAVVREGEGWAEVEARSAVLKTQPEAVETEEVSDEVAVDEAE
jgi:hypothetical protein